MIAMFINKRYLLNNILVSQRDATGATGSALTEVALIRVSPEIAMLLLE